MKTNNLVALRPATPSIRPSAADHDTLHKQLTDRAAALAGLLKADTREAASSDRVVDINDQGTKNEEFTALMIRHQHYHREHNEVCAALARFANGTYGICEECDEPIAAARLAVRPAACLCVDCQEAIEHRGTRRVRLAG
jgi:DnaK suppressor protein